MSADWLDIGEREGENGHLPVPASALPEEYKARLALVEAAWSRLSEKQKLFLAAWRDCRYNERAATKQIGLSENTKPMTAGMNNPDFAMVVRVWRANVAADALDRDRLLARHEDIIETAMTPKPVLYQGEPTGFEEVEVGVAARANAELLDRVMPKPREGIEVNVGVYTPVSVEVEKPAASVIEGTTEAIEVEVSEWLK